MEAVSHSIVDRAGNRVSLLQMRNAVVALMQKIEFNRAVLFGLLVYGWNVAAGVVTALLITTRFTPELQGYFYTFMNILAMQVFVELGLGTVIIQFASHEWAHLRMDKTGNISGDPDALSRLVSVARISLRWYLIGSVLLTLCLGAGGSLFFRTSQSVSIDWLFPWLTVCVLTGLTVCLVPVWALLEGCNQVAQVYTFRFWQGLCVSSAVWCGIVLGAGLWTVAISGLVTVICSGIYLRRTYTPFLRTVFFSRPRGPVVTWRSNMLPFQWRIALSWISGYFTFNFFTPVLFKYHGPVIAGQMGMTLNLIYLVGAIPTAWLTPKVPHFGMLVARKQYKELDLLFWKIVRIFAFICAATAGSIWIGVYALDKLHYDLAARILPPATTGVFLLAHFIANVNAPMSCYLRAHKREPLLLLSVMQGILIGLSTVTLGRYYAALGIASGYLLVVSIAFPFGILVWYQSRKVWHAE